MIDEQRTLEIYGYISTDLSKGSNKPIITVCEECGKYNKVMFKSYNKQKHFNLCNSCSKSGKNHPMYGKHHTKETKRKMSESGKIKIFTDEHKANISNAKKGKNHSMFGIKGKDHPNFGKHHSDETKKKMSDAQRGKKNHRYGKHWDDEWKKSHSKKMLGKKHPLFGTHMSLETRIKSSCTKQNI